MTGFDEEGVFSLRPLFYDENNEFKFCLSSSNFSVRYETYYNDRCADGYKKLKDAKKNGKKPKRKKFENLNFKLLI